MPLQSNLFRDDSALQACLVRDSAHVVKGARGQHVARIQKALVVLDGALMASDELAASVYGPTTAAAVLAYKRARDIVNRSYQQKADDIVGKMTIASLDREMAAGEERPLRRVCREPSQGVAGSGSPARVRFAARELVGDAPQARFPAILSVLFQFVKVRDKFGPHTFALPVDTRIRANELLAPFGMQVSSTVGASFAIPFKVHLGEEEEFVGLRKAAENSIPKFKGALRVIICPFRKNDNQDDDLKTNAASMSLKGFDRFIVMNSNLLRADKGTLLHEMIHCSRENLMGEFRVHDEDDDTSIFSWGPNRTKLNVRHAQALQGAFFALRK